MLALRRRNRNSYSHQLMYLEGHEQRLIYHNRLGQEGKSGE